MKCCVVVKGKGMFVALKAVVCVLQSNSGALRS